MEQEARSLLEQLRSTARAKTAFAQMPRNVRRADMPSIRPDRYVCAPKTDGERVSVLLGATVQGDDRPFAALFNRAKRYRALKLSKSVEDALQDDLPQGRDAFCGTLLEAERLGDGALVVFDAVVVAGYDVSAKPFGQRLAAAAPLVKALGSGVAMKRWRPIAELTQAYAEPGPPRDGVILMPESPEGVIWKWKAEHTLDFQWKDGAWWYGDGAELKQVAALGIEMIDHPGGDEDKKREAREAREEGVYECAPRGGRDFAVVARRCDKTAPNNRVTVERTLESVDENLQLHELESVLAGGDRDLRPRKRTRRNEGMI